MLSRATSTVGSDARSADVVASSDIESVHRLDTLVILASSPPSVPFLAHCIAPACNAPQLTSSDRYCDACGSSLAGDAAARQVANAERDERERQAGVRQRQFVIVMMHLRYIVDYADRMPVFTVEGRTFAQSTIITWLSRMSSTDWLGALRKCGGGVSQVSPSATDRKEKRDIV